jgi:ketosteroid isomerase-like protein
MNTLIARLFVLTATLLCLTLTGCSRSDPEKALRGTVDKMQAAAAARDASGVLEHLAEDFVRDSGGMDKAQVRGLLVGLFIRNQKVMVTTTVREVTITGNTATARIHVLATGGAGLIPERADGWEFTTAWRKEGSAWKLYNAQWND